MKPKEKAIELVNKYWDLNIGWSICCQCALIVVDEIIEQYEFDVVSDVENKRFIAKLNYWDEVKKEIEKL